jgi:hypothetical protein
LFPEVEKLLGNAPKFFCKPHWWWDNWLGNPEKTLFGVNII